MSPPEREHSARRLLASSLRGRGRALWEIAAWSLVQALPAFLSGRLIAEALDDGFLAGRAGTGFAWLGALGAAALLGTWGTRQTLRRLAALVEPLRDELAERAVRGALRRSTASGAPADTAGVARLTQQVEIVREAYAAVLISVQTFLVVAVGAVLGLLALVPVALVLVVPPLLLGLAILLGALAAIAARQRDSILAEERIAETASTMAEGLRDVVACGAEARVGAAVGEHIEAQAQATRDLARTTAVRTAAVGLGGLLPAILILIGGPWLLRQGASTGAIVGALAYVLQGVHPALQTLVRGLGGPGLWLVVAMRRIAEADEPPARSRAEAPSPRPPVAGDGGRPRLQLSGVTFGYGRHAEPVISGLDLVVPEGDHLAIVGPSGIGKSTLANLIAGLLEPQRGQVRLGDVAVGDLDLRAAARRRVLIPQESYVFAGTLWENLTYLREDVPGAEVDRAVRLLGAEALVERLGGYGSEIRPEVLSAGERQLLTLVRAYLSEAELAILDEATCHLDPAAEERVERAFAGRAGTLIVVAHRISSAVRARRVLVLDGSEVHLGDHRQLLARSALYRDLVGRWQAGVAVP